MSFAQTSFPEMTAEQVERLRPLWAEFERALRTDPDYLVLIAEAGLAAREESIRTAWDAALVESRERARMQKASERAAAAVAAAERRRAAQSASRPEAGRRRAGRKRIFTPEEARERRLQRQRDKRAARTPEQIAVEMERQRQRRAAMKAARTQAVYIAV